MELKRIMDEKGPDVTAAMAAETEQATKVSVECFKSVFMLENLDPQQFLTLFTDLRKDMIKKHDNFPCTVIETFDMLNQWKPDNNRRGNGQSSQPQPRQIGHTYAQTGGPPAGPELVPGHDGTTSKVLCYGCQNWGHISPNCLNGCSHTGHSLMQYGICLMQSFNHNDTVSNGAINKAWILLDSCSTLNCVCNPSLVTNVRPCKKN